MVTQTKQREKALEDLKISAMLTLPLSFIIAFILFSAPCLLKDKICNPAPFFSAYALGFVVGYLISDKILHMSDWILDENKEPVMAKGKKGIQFALISIVVGYVIGILNAYSYACIMGLSYTWFDILCGWGVIVGGAGYSGFFGGWAFKTQKIISSI